MSVDKRKILIVDDSALMRRTESDIITSDSRFTVVGTCVDGLEAFDTVSRNPKGYDVILIEINLPRMTGLEFLAALKKSGISVRTIIISSQLKIDSKETIQALQLGAFDFLSKPDSFLELRGEAFRAKLIEKIELATKSTSFSLFKKSFDKPSVQEIPQPEGRPHIPVFPKVPEGTISQKPVTPEFNRENVPQYQPATSYGKTAEPQAVVSPMNAREILAAIKTPRRPHSSVSSSANKLILIAVSTGGPKALQTVLPGIPENINAPVLIVQHMAAGFTKSLAERLNHDSRINVIEAQHGMVIQKGNAYIAQGGAQMRLRKVGYDYIIDENTAEPARNALKPCADVLFESIAGMDFDELICCVLTGMGGDGTMGIHALCQKNNCYVIAQDERTSTVYGMPKVVFEAGLTDSVKPLDEVANEITKNTGVN